MLLAAAAVLGASSIVLLTPSPASATSQLSAWHTESMAAPEIPPSLMILPSVSCTSSTSCVAVGYYVTSPGEVPNPVPSAETLSGSGWSLDTVPEPSGATYGAYLHGVSCTSSTSCVAVGYYVDSSHDPVPFAETLSGSEWSLDTVPEPSGATNGAGLFGVSCTSSTSCVAVGYYYSSSSFDEVPFAETLSGSGWSPNTVPDPSGATNGTGLHGVSCTSSTSCVAVGYYYSSSFDEVPFAETLSGSGWSLDTVPEPSVATGAGLGGVSCTSSTSCVAVGYYHSSSGAVPFAETLSGSGWSLDTVPEPSGATPGAVLFGVSCTSSTSCVAVGSYRSGSGGAVPFAATPLIAPPAPSAPVLSSLSPASGSTSGGTVVTVQGQNLLGAAYVRFGHIEATSFDVVSPTEIQATSPPGSGSAKVSVITPGGTSNDLPFTYTTAGTFRVTPTRICDTRTGNPSDLSGTALSQCEGKAPGAGQTLTISIPGISSDTSVILSVTVIDPSSSGYLTVTAAGLTESTPTREVSVQEGVTQSTSVLVDTSPSGQVSITNHTPTTLNLAVDLESTGNLPLIATTPTRICDTRTGNPSDLSGTALSQCEGKAPGAGQTLTINADGLGEIPGSGVAAVLAQVTDINPAAGGYLTLFEPGQAAPTVSQVTNVPAQVSSNLLLVPVDQAGELAVYSSGGDPNIAIDVYGYVPDTPSSTTPYLEASAEPIGICDTMPGNPSDLSGTALSQCEGKAPGAGQTLDLRVAPASPPTGASAAFVAVTSEDATLSTYLTTWNGVGTPPVASVSNPEPGVTQTHPALAGLDPQDGAFGIYNYQGSAQLSVDVLGWVVQAGS